MTSNKSQISDASVAEFLDTIEGQQRRADCRQVCAIRHGLSGDQARIWGGAMLGFGRYH